MIVVLFDESSKPELSANESATSSKSFKRLTAVVVVAYRTKKENNLYSPNKLLELIQSCCMNSAVLQNFFKNHQINANEYCMHFV